MEGFDHGMDVLNLFFVSDSSQRPPFAARRVLHGRYVFRPSAHRGKGQDAGIVCAGFEDCSPDYVVSRDGFPFPALELIAGGEWELVSQGVKTILGPGMIFTYGPGVTYSLSARSAQGLKKYFVDFASPEAAIALRRAGVADGVPKALLPSRWVQDLIEQIIDTGRLQEPQRSALDPMLVRLLLERVRSDLRPARRQKTAAWLTFERCRAWLAANYLHPSDLAQSAAACGVTQVHMCRLFRRYAGETPHAFVTRMKMDHAAELILRGNMAVKEAASEVGFEDPFHFSRVFKKVHGAAPSLLAASRRRGRISRLAVTGEQVLM